MTLRDWHVWNWKACVVITRLHQHWENIEVNLSTEMPGLSKLSVWSKDVNTQGVPPPILLWDFVVWVTNMWAKIKLVLIESTYALLTIWWIHLSKIVSQDLTGHSRLWYAWGKIIQIKKKPKLHRSTYLTLDIGRWVQMHYSTIFLQVLGRRKGLSDKIGPKSAHIL